jgi:ABC-2 type transport system ATP-binding protein
MTSAIAVSGLRKRYGAATVLDGIDFDVPAGTVFALLGPNGAGKTTTVHILSTLIRPDAGRVTIAGRDLARDPDGVRAAIGLTGQFAAVDGLLTGAENLRLMADLRHLGARAGRRRVGELLERFDLTDAAGKRLATYSGGMKRRLDLGLALVHGPRLLFLDEPTTGLDPQSRAALWDEVRRLANDGVTVFLTTQYLEEADVLADRVGIIDRGKIVAEGTPAELKAAIGRPSVEAIPADPGDRDRLEAVLHRFGEAAAASPNGVAARLPEGVGDLAEIVRTLDAEGIPIADLRLHTPTLDDVFLAKTGRSLEGAGDGEGDEDEQPDTASVGS